MDETSLVGSSPKRRWVKFGIGLVLAAAIVALLATFRNRLSIDYLAAQEQAFRGYQAQHPATVYLVAFATYVAITALSLPGAAALTIVMGWLLGWWQATVLVSFASTTGATLAFLVSRYLFRDAVQAKFGDRLARFNDGIRREGAFYLFTLRLIVGVPFVVVNLVMGLTPLRVGTFWWVSQLGMLPGTLLYTYVGHAVPSLAEVANRGASAVFSGWQLTQIFVAFALLGMLPWGARWVIVNLRPRADRVP